MRGLFALVSVSLLVPCGCGYKLLGSEAGLTGVGSISVQTPRNDSFKPGLELVVADALRRELLRRGAAEVTDDPRGADLVVTGRVLPMRSQARSFSSVVLALEYEITLALDLRVERREGGEVPIDPRALLETERYLASADIEALRKNEEEALHRLSKLLAGRFCDSLVAALAP